jgi:phosphate transport system substrate-binding protein
MVTETQARTLIQNKGSDTLVNVAQAWAEVYAKKSPDVAVSVSGGGSGTGIAAMINGTVDIANASRKMKSKELKAAKAKGQDPVEHVVGYDALAVFMHKDNPAKSIGIDQLKEIFSRGGKATSWGDLGLVAPAWTRRWQAPATAAIPSPDRCSCTPTVSQRAT